MGKGCICKKWVEGEIYIMKVLSGMYCAEMQLQHEVVSCCRKALQYGIVRPNLNRTAEDWKVLREKYMNTIKDAFPGILFEKNKPLNCRVISSYELEDCNIENVVFESLPGWEVNGTVYLPKKPGRYPGVICPTGHSSKTYRNYQRSARTFARNGYAAISFDPPGCSGEKQLLNDHFTNGALGYLTGLWSMTHFVADALSAMDYMETRGDVDAGAGFTMTGVSGGGLTSIFASILDERVKFCAPVCCLSEHEKIHLKDLYTSCPEQFGHGFIKAGMDYSDYLCLIAPRPCLVVAGKQDEVFDVKSTMRLFEDAARIYKVTGNSEKIGLFIDEGAAHAYTVKMANEAAGWMNRIIKGSDLPALELKEEDIKDIEPEKLKCHPSENINMFTMNRDEAVRLKSIRMSFGAAGKTSGELCMDVKSCLGITDDVSMGFSGVNEQKPQLRWFHSIQKLDIQRDGDIHIPGLFMKRASRKGKSPALLFIDESGKWEGFKQNGFLARAVRFLEEEPCDIEPIILSIDVSGFGELEPEPAAYDLAGWNDIERILTYLSIADGEPVMGLRVRDVLAALAYLEKCEDVDARRIMVGGRGIGAIAALHAASIWGRASKVICMDMLSHYGALTENFPYTWRQSILIPDILKYYDLPDLAGCLSGSTAVHIINPLDGKHSKTVECVAEELYEEAIKRGMRLHCLADDIKPEQLFTDIVLERLPAAVS